MVIFTEEQEQEYLRKKARKQEELVKEREQTIMLTYMGGGLVSLQYEGIDDTMRVSWDEWQQMIQEHKSKAEVEKRLMIVKNPNGTHSPFGFGCPEERYDFR